MNKNLKKLISTVAALAITATSAFSAFAANFSDVADTADYKTAVDNLVALGIVNGYEDGTFKPENLITRAESSKMIVGTMGPAMMDAAEASKGSTNFTDVAADHWATGYIAQGVGKGYIKGMGDGTFAPESNVTYAQMVKMLVCVLGYAEDAEVNGGWPNGYLNQATTLGVTDGVKASADTAVNRGQVAILINNALDIPVKSITGYEPGFKMENGQLVSTSVPKTEVYDGKGDSGKYETLLTTYFDAYSVRGRIVNTEEKGKGVVDFTVEYADNFDGDVDVYNGKKDSDGNLINKETVEVYYPAGLDVDSLLCAYSDAIIMENEDGDWELVSIAPYGKNDVVAVDAELYVDGTFEMSDGKNDGYIEFYQSKTSSKKDDYKLDPNVAVYVNGTEVTSKVADTVEKYLADPTATFKLVNTPKAGSKTIDSKIDYIMITSYITAVVDEVVVDDDEVKIYLEDSTAGISEIVLDLEAVADGEAEYIFADAEGNAVAYEDLEENDVLTIYAPTMDASDLKKGDVYFLNVTVTKDVVSGKITRQDKDEEIYEIGGEEYAFAGDYVSNLSIGDDYTFYLNAFGKIAMYEKTASVVNYGIVNKVWENNNGEKVVRMVDATGSIVTYEFNKAADYTAWKIAYDALASKEFVSDKAYETLIVTYKVNANNKIYSLTSVGDEFDITSAEFTEKSQKVGKAKMSDLTKVVDYSDAKDIWSDSLSGKVASGSVASFADGEDYTVIFGGDKFTDGTYPFVVVISGVAKVGTASNFAVVKSSGKAVNDADGIEYFSATVLEGKDEKKIYFEDEDVEIEKGDVIVYSVNGEGLVESENFYVLFNGNTDIALTKVAAANNANGGVILPYASSMPWETSKYGDDDKQAQLGYGVLVDRTSNSVSIGTVENGKTEDFDDYDVVDGANIYVYDQGIKKGDKVSVGSMASLTPTKLASRYTEDDVYKWAEAGEEEVKTVFFKTYEGDITDIIVILPND